jgi:hypothetical protein
MPLRPGARRVWRLFFVVTVTLVGVLGLTRPAFAQAQITVVNANSLPRLDNKGKVVTKRPSALTPEGVSYQDCIDDQQIQFTLQMAGYEVGGSVQAWASIGQDCSAQTARGGGYQLCWRAYDSDIPLSQTATINVPVRKVMAGGPQPNAPDATENICGKVDLANIQIQFLYFAPGSGGANGTAAASVTITVDTVGPAPPSGLRTKPGNTRITVEWNQISGGTDVDGGTATGGGVTDLLGVRVYCDVAQATTSTTANAPICADASSDLDAGDEAGTTETCTDGGTTTSSSGACSTPNFTGSDGDPAIPTADFDTKYLCGSLNGTGGTSVTATGVGGKPLANETTYAVALAGTDRFGNVGRLSSVRCEVPEVTSDFWDAYRNDGGHAGDGCSTAGQGGALGSLATLSAGVALALSSIFRAHRRAKLTKGSGR